MMLRSLMVLLLAAVLGPRPAVAGGGPLNTLVVVNRSSRNSRALGAYYAQQHGIPNSHLCSIQADSRSSTISLDDFERQIRAPIAKHITGHNLDGQIHYLVLCMDIPTRVENFNGITAALFYGFKAAEPDAPQCNIAPDSVNQYFGAETAYTSSAGWNRTNAPIPFLLTAESLDLAKAAVDRAVASDAAFPNGVFCLYGSGDSARNIRHRTYAHVARRFEEVGLRDRLIVNPAADPVPDRPVLGLMTGRAYLPTQYIGMVFAPGAIAEHLTSCAGMIPDPCYNQSSVWDWMRLGSTVSYGTVSEPCAFREKFPDPMLFFWYSRGFTAGEALAMSVRNPYQGLWVGDPLAAPFAAPPSVRILSPAPHESLDGETPLRIAVAAHDRGSPPVFLDLYVDGRHHAPVVRPIAPVGNRLHAQIGTNRFSYTVAPAEDLFAAVAGLAWAINAKGRGQITAKAVADRLEISVRQPMDRDGRPLAFSVDCEQGFGRALYIGAQTSTPRLVVEEGLGRAAAVIHLGAARTYEIEYPLDPDAFEPGSRLFTLVVRDGTAMQCQSQTDLPLRIPKR